MVKSKNKTNQIDVIKSSKKIKSDKVVKEIEDMTSLFDNIKKSIKNKNSDLMTKKIASSGSRNSNDNNNNINTNNLSNSTIEDNDITTYGKMKTSSSSSSSKRRKDDNIEDSRTYGIIKSNLNTIIINPEAPIERIDKDSGLPVYKAHLLKVGEGGGKILLKISFSIVSNVLFLYIV
jgi:hypothetical protein